MPLSIGDKVIITNKAGTTTVEGAVEGYHSYPLEGIVYQIFVADTDSDRYSRHDKEFK